jgi:D-alanine transfer protein
VKTPHLLPAAVAVLLLAVALGAGYRYARQVERRSVHSVTTTIVRGMAHRPALRVEVARHPDLLPVYGSSELLIDDPYHATALFRDYPTGFTVVPVGQQAGCSLLQIQHLAAVGSTLRGKKVALSFTPSTFFADSIRPEPYAGNFWRPNANDLAFSMDLGFPIKQAVARRMLTYPRTLEQDPLLEFALRQLADGSPLARSLYYAALPLGRLQAVTLRLQDHWNEIGFLAGADLPPDPRPAPGRALHPLDWSGLAVEAEREYRERSCNNPFGFENQIWVERFVGKLSDTTDPTHDGKMRRVLDRAKEWSDLETLLNALHEWGAEPCILVTPMNAAFADRIGISPETRRVYHERLRALALAHGVPLVDSADHEPDCDFLIDTNHLSSKGWVYFAYALDGFYHGRRGPDLVLAPTTTPPVDYREAALHSPRDGTPACRHRGRPPTALTR